MADYRWDNPDLQTLVQGVIEDERLPLEDLREHMPHIRVGTIFYADDDAFDSASRKKQGGRGVRIRLTDNWVRSLTSGNGLLRGTNDNATGVEVVILVDPALFNAMPEHAQRGHIFNVLSWLRLEHDEDEEGGVVAKMKDGRPVWRIVKPPQVSAITTRLFGAIDATSAAIIEASAEAAKKQLTMETLWRPEEPKVRAEKKAITDAAPWSKEGDEPRDVGDGENEGE